MDTPTPPKKPANAPTLARIVKNSDRARKATHSMPATAIGMSVAQIVVYAGLGKNMPWLFYAFGVGAVLVFVLWLRWDRNAARHRDANLFLPRFALSDERDLAWMTWVQWYEPRTQLLLTNEGPTSRDMLAAMSYLIEVQVDAGYRAPYFGDTERCNDDLDERRKRERAN